MSAGLRPDEAAVFALGAVTPAERAAFERLMERDPSLIRVVEDLRRVAGLLAWAAPPADPPPALRGRILASLPVDP
ncbi:MAG: hypothetical protein ACT4P7_20885 [Gemmatimonadaceae bacterium]